MVHFKELNIYLLNNERIPRNVKSKINIYKIQVYMPISSHKDNAIKEMYEKILKIIEIA